MPLACIPNEHIVKVVCVKSNPKKHNHYIMFYFSFTFNNTHNCIALNNVYKLAISVITFMNISD